MKQKMKLSRNSLLLEVCIIAVFCYTLLPVTGDTLAETPREYGETCSSGISMLCNTNETVGLRCSETAVDPRCECKNGRTYDPNMKICLANDHEECDLRPSNGSLPVLCTAHADCLKVGPSLSTSKCFCVNGYSRTLDGECRLTKGSQCSDTAFCNPYEYLICVNNTCECTASEIWDSEKKTCVALLNGDCHSELLAPKQCVGKKDTTKCENNVCGCADPLTKPNSLRTRCVAGLKAACELDTDCQDSLSCIPSTQTPGSKVAPGNDMDEYLMANVCGCKETVGEWYNEKSERCEILADQTCDPTDSIKKCVVNSECKGSKCTCNSGFEVSNGQCSAGYGAGCDADPSVCNSKLYLGCDATSKKCECKQGYTYNPNLKVCVGSIDSECSNNENCDPNFGACNAQKKCECRSGYVMTPQRTCLAGYDTTCSLVECNTADFLVCNSNQRCACAIPEDQIYDKEIGKCVALSGGKCVANGNGISCVSNATCSSEGICECDENFEADEARLCNDAGHGIHIAAFTIILFVFVSSMM